MRGTDLPSDPATNISAAKRALAERAFDFVIINSPLPDDIGTRFAIDTGSFSLLTQPLFNLIAISL